MADLKILSLRKEKINSFIHIKTLNYEKNYISYSNCINCSKQEISDQTGAQKQELKMSDEDIAIMNKIVAFRDKVAYAKENPGYKSGETMTSDEAVWNLEILFNASYGFPDEQYGKTKTDTTILQISTDENGDVLLDDVVAKYDEIIAVVTQYYYNSGFSQKGFLLLDLEQGNLSNGQMEIELRAVTGEKNEGWEPFGDDDNWWFGNEAGDCNWDSAGTDAAEKIQEALMNNRPLVSPPPGYKFVYDYCEPIPRFGHEYTNDEGEYLIFYIPNATGIFTWEEKCLHMVNEVNELNFHFWGEETVIYEILRQEYNMPANQVFMECDISGHEELNSNQGDIPSIHHQNDLTYAFRYLVPIGIIKPPVEL